MFADKCLATKHNEPRSDTLIDHPKQRVLSASETGLQVWPRAEPSQRSADPHEAAKRLPPTEPSVSAMDSDVLWRGVRALSACKANPTLMPRSKCHDKSTTASTAPVKSFESSARARQSIPMMDHHHPRTSMDFGPQSARKKPLLVLITTTSLGVKMMMIVPAETPLSPMPELRKIS